MPIWNNSKLGLTGSGYACKLGSGFFGLVLNKGGDSNYGGTTYCGAAERRDAGDEPAGGGV